MKHLILLTPFFFCLSCDDQPKNTADSASTGESTPQSSTPTESSSKRAVTKSSRKNQAERAQIASAKKAMVHLIQACDAFYEEYQALPGAGKSAIDAAQITTTPLLSKEEGSPFMAALLGLTSASPENPKRLAFFEVKAAKDKKDGLSRFENGAELFDPWGTPYHVLLNYDYDNQLRILSISKEILEEIFYDRKVLVWSAGPDGKIGPPDFNKDNIYSWESK